MLSVANERLRSPERYLGDPISLARAANRSVVRARVLFCNRLYNSHSSMSIMRRDAALPDQSAPHRMESAFPGGEAHFDRTSRVDLDVPAPDLELPAHDRHRLVAPITATARCRS